METQINPREFPLGSLYIDFIPWTSLPSSLTIYLTDGEEIEP